MKTRRIKANEMALLQRIAFKGDLESQLSRLKTADVEELDEEGSIRFVREDRMITKPQKKCPVEAQFQDKDGVYVHALLFTLEDEVDELEIYKDDGSKIESFPASDEWELIKL